VAGKPPALAGRVLAVATYYLPYISGLTVFLQRLAAALGEVGWQVTVLTSRHAPGLPAQEVLEGVPVVRVPVWARVSKGVVMPSLAKQLLRLGRQAEVVLLVLPQADAAPLAWLAKRVLGKPLVAVVLCDVALEGGGAARLLERALRLSHRWALRRADAVVALDAGYAASSPLFAAAGGELRIVPPPVPLPVVQPGSVEALRQRLGLAAGEPVVGWVGRVSREKGLEVFAEAMPRVWEVFPSTKVLCAGPQEVPGEARYRRALAARVAAFGPRFRFIGPLASQELGAFYRLASVMAFPSVNRTEAFGMVQVEAMGCGTPVVASDLPGVRSPVVMTGMGLLVPPGDPPALAEALIQVLHSPEAFRKGSAHKLALFAPERVAAQYAALFAELLASPVRKLKNLWHSED
jgi:glycosyltransferase involved in cell wall biosynthesis